MNRNILLVVWMFSLASICYAQTPEHLWSVADYCAAATQDAKDNVPTAQAEAKCKYPPEFTKRCIDKPREMSRISNHTRDAVCAARTAREAKAILVKAAFLPCVQPQLRLPSRTHKRIRNTDAARPAMRNSL